MSSKRGFGDPLYTPDNPKLDIVFVHGLHGDRETTWTKSNVFWPKALLPKAVENARILSFGYDADVAKLWSPPSEETLTNHANSLVAALVGLRSETNTTDLPIIFVAHSLGGLVCAKAIVRAAAKPIADSRKVEGSTRRIAFLGTPFNGSHAASLGEIVRRVVSVVCNTNSTTLQDLKPDALLDLKRELVEWLNRRNSQAGSDAGIVCFFEAEAPSFSGSGRIVSQESAEVMGFETLPLNANHANMCKFDDESDSNYRKVVDVLRRWAKEVTQPSEGPPVESQQDTNFTNSGTNTGFQFGKISGGNMTNNVKP